MKASGLFQHSAWDAVPVLAAIGQAAYLILLFTVFPSAPWWVLVPMGLLYAVSISWNINGISHNFLHNPYFASEALNRLFSLLLSLELGFSQTFYEDVHLRHHSGNSDRKDAAGRTVDPLSIYRYSRTDGPDNVLAFTFLAYFRDDVGETFRRLYSKRRARAYFGLFEIACVVCIAGLLTWANWRFMAFFLPFYYLGHSLSSLNGYYEHFGANPDVPIAWGVSSYGKLYNWIWFNNGYHAEHHYRPKVHWTQMKALHRQIAVEQRAAGVKVIRHSHALGFIDAWAAVRQ
ncbi:MAG TPA: fatty acid desaturase [Candidatus Cybelea sp.]|nr:fatty acid desaturase [Candidatus Cybelea sp.]